LLEAGVLDAAKLEFNSGTLRGERRLSSWRGHERTVRRGYDTWISVVAGWGVHLHAAKVHP
jgi:hypothetical protein